MSDTTHPSTPECDADPVPWLCTRAPEHPLTFTYGERYRPHAYCRLCVIAAGAVYVNHGPSIGAHDAVEGRFLTLSDFYEQHRHRHGLPALPVRWGS